MLSALRFEITVSNKSHQREHSPSRRSVRIESLRLWPHRWFRIARMCRDLWGGRQQAVVRSRPGQARLRSGHKLARHCIQNLQIGVVIRRPDVLDIPDSAGRSTRSAPPSQPTRSSASAHTGAARYPTALVSCTDSLTYSQEPAGQEGARAPEHEACYIGRRLTPLSFRPRLFYDRLVDTTRPA